MIVSMLFCFHMPQGVERSQGSCLYPCPITLLPPQAVEGLPACSEEEARLYHTTFIDVEPISGIPMRGRQRIMVSSEITKQVGPIISHVDFTFACLPFLNCCLFSS